jgi:tRNA (Thr-GGU) A37 N-methylase
MEVWHELIVITWMHEASRAARAVRSPASFTRAHRHDRNRSALHPVTVREIDGTRLKIGPIEAFDGTPVVDIKSASTRTDG